MAHHGGAMSGAPVSFPRLLIISAFFAFTSCGVSRISGIDDFLAVDAGQSIDAGTLADAGEVFDAGSAQAIAVSFPQAVGGAFEANPALFSSIPLRIKTVPIAIAVELKVGVATLSASDTDGDGVFTVSLPIASLADGVFDLTATATAPALLGQATAKLTIAHQGLRLTDWAESKLGNAPRLHAVGSELWLTWADKLNGVSQGWLRSMDGAGQWRAGRVALTDPGQDTFYVRTAVGASTIAVLAQGPGTPYHSYWRVVGFDGQPVGDDLPLDPMGWVSQRGGDVYFDGQNYVAAWRLHDGMGGAEVRWLKVDEAKQAMTGPVVVMHADASDSNNYVPFFQPTSVRSQHGNSLVSYVRAYMHPLVQTPVYKTRIATLSSTGAVMGNDFAGPAADFSFHKESRVFIHNGRMLPMWTAEWLNDSATNPSVHVYGTQATAQGTLDSARGAGTDVLSNSDSRSDIFLISGETGASVLAWVDNRQGPNVLPQVRYAVLDGALKLGPEKVISHANVVGQLADFGGTYVGGNVVLVWVDYRQGGPGANQRPEVWMETLWF
jgi:hypothetical protein